MSPSISFTYNIYTATRAELVGRQKSRAVVPREQEVVRVKKWREHVDQKDDYWGASEDNASLLAGTAREVKPACGLGPEPCDQAYEACLERQHNGCVNMDGLTTQSPVPQPSPLGDEIKAQNVSLHDIEAENELLRQLQADRRSIILHSARPEETPHIVITPPPRPQFDAEQDGIWANTLPVQWIGRIFVPPQPWQWVSYVPPAPWGPEGGWWYRGGYAQPPPQTMHPYNIPTAEESSSVRDSLHSVGPEGFTHLVALAAQEHLARYQTPLPLYQNLYKAAAYTVSELAPQFRERWDIEGYPGFIEKAFIWEDPAAPLLQYFNRNRGVATHIIESAQPFVTPHIVIEDSPSQPPWEADFNKIPYQAACSGSRLTASSARQGAIEEPSQSNDGCISLEILPIELEEYDLSADSDTTLDSIELESPQDVDFVYDTFPVDVGTDKDYSYPAQYPAQYSAQYTYAPLDCDDDEDGLPSLDDEFYQSTARRYGIELHSS